MLDILKNEILPNAEKYCKKNWEKVFATIQQGIDLFERAMQEGILMLEDNVESLRPKYRYNFVRMIIDGDNIRCLEEIMKNWYYVNNLSGLKAYLFLIDCIMILGLPYHSKERLALSLKPLLPQEYYEKLGKIKSYLEKGCGTAEETLALVREGKAEKVFDFHLANNDGVLETIAASRDAEVGRILQKADDDTVIAALQFSTPKLINKFFRNMDDKRVVRVISKMESHAKRDGWSRKDAECAKRQLEESSHGWGVYPGTEED